MLAEAVRKGDTLDNKEESTYVPVHQDCVLALLGDGSRSESNVVTVCPLNKHQSRHPDASRVSERSVIIANQRGYESLFPTKNLRLFAEGSGRRKHKNTAEGHSHDFSNISGTWVFKKLTNVYIISFQQSQNTDCKIVGHHFLMSCDTFPHFPTLSACMIPSTYVQSLSDPKWAPNYDMCGALFSGGSGGLKVEAQFSSEKYLHPGKDSASVYFDWYLSIILTSLHLPPSHCFPG